MSYLYDPNSYDYHLPSEAIAQEPLNKRDQARLLVLKRAEQTWTHAHVYDLPDLLYAGDTMVLNNTKVLPARLLGVRAKTGGKTEVLLTKKQSTTTKQQTWTALIKPARRLKIGDRILFGGSAAAPEHRPVIAEILEKQEAGHATLRLFLNDKAPGKLSLRAALEKLGIVPLPPYITQALPDADRYQTVFARKRGAVAAPTAGLHFTEELLGRLAGAGVGRAEVTLHVGPGTFRPLDMTDVRGQALHPESYQLTRETVQAIAQTKEKQGRVLAVGTTTTRVLEAEARLQNGKLTKSGRGATRLFIYPGFAFKIVDALLTNFHLPKTSLLMLVCAFAAASPAGAAETATEKRLRSARDFILAAYNEAIDKGYRFYSFGDAMLII